MFKKIKQKVTDAKNWAVEHKKEIFIGAVLGVAGTLGVIAVNKSNEPSVREKLDGYINNCKPGENLLVDVIKVERKSDGYFWGHGDMNNPTVENLSASLLDGNEERKDEIVIGALVYTKKQ